MKKIASYSILFLILFSAGFAYWVKLPIITSAPAIEFTIKPGSGLSAVAQQINDAGVPVNAPLFMLLARITDKSGRIKAGSYELKPGATPLRLLNQLVRGEFAQEVLVIIEGWTFKQMRQAIAVHPGLKHDTGNMSEADLMQKIAPDYANPEGLFFPDTYLFAKGASDMQIFRQAHATLMRRLGDAWDKRDAALPYTTPYQALIMASIIEKETGQAGERSQIAAVFINRLRLGMLLQTDPTVIYGMGERYQGKIRKRDLETDTPYNTYTRSGMPPTPIALPGVASLMAALAPARSDALYFVAKNDGSSQFSDNLPDHNRAVNKYQRNQPGK
jgi:UPF0755 protein